MYCSRSELYPRSNSKDFTPEPVIGRVADSFNANLTTSPAVPIEGAAKGLETIPKSIVFLLERVTLLVNVIGERVLSAVLVIESEPFITKEPPVVSTMVVIGIFVLLPGISMIGNEVDTVNPFPPISAAVIISVSHPLLKNVITLSRSSQRVVVPKSIAAGIAERSFVPLPTKPTSDRELSLLVPVPEVFFERMEIPAVRFPFSFGANLNPKRTVSPGLIEVFVGFAPRSVKSGSPLRVKFPIVSGIHPVFVKNPSDESAEEQIESVSNLNDEG